MDLLGTASRPRLSQRVFLSHTSDLGSDADPAPSWLLPSGPCFAPAMP
jgi:hypothetical protein